MAYLVFVELFLDFLYVPGDVSLVPEGVLSQQQPGEHVLQVILVGAQVHRAATAAGMTRRRTTQGHRRLKTNTSNSWGHLYTTQLS